MTIIKAQPLLAKSTGDVEGPASALNNEVPVFDGATGKKIKAGSGVINPSAGRLDLLELRAKDGDGLKVYEDGGAGIFIKDGGNVGINQNDPACKLHLTDGAILAAGVTGGTPASGAGTRLMWIPAKAAFRSGGVGGDRWNDANIGLKSFGSGQDVKPSGHGSFASGYGAEATGWGSFAQGKGSTGDGNLLQSTSYGSFAQGYPAWGNMTATNYGSFVQGMAMGGGMFSSGFGSFCQGMTQWGTITSSGSASFAQGGTTGGNIISSGLGSFAQGGATANIEATNTGSLAIGDDIISSGVHSKALGYGLRALGDYTFVSGKFMQLSAAANNSFVFGHHASAVALTQPNTFYIFPAGTAGKVAVGTQTPATSAIMDLTSTIGALLLPRMTTAQRNALTAVNGMVIYSTSNNRLEAYENGAWIDL